MQPRILVVEDDRLVGLDVERMLVKSGYRVLEIVPSAEEALETVEAEKPDLVLMDIVLQGAMDGISAAGIIRQEYDIPVLFLSAHSDAETLDRAKGADSAGYILKPVRERELYVSTEMALYKRDMECRLRESEEHQKALEQVFENFSEAIIVLGPDGIIQRANAGFKRLFLYSRDEVIGRTIDHLIIPSGHRSRVNDLLMELSRKSFLSFETSRMRKDGGLVDVSILALPVLRNGKVVSLYIIYKDVSEQARLQKAMRRTQRLDSIALLAGGVAHDFNNIIATVLGNVSLAKMHCGNDRQLTALLARAEQAAVRARDLTGQLLAFSKDEEAKPATICLEGLLREALDLSLSGSNVVGKLDLGPGIHPVFGGEGQFAQIFNNLIINAKQAMPGGGTVTITVRNRDDLDQHFVQVELPSGPYVQVLVCDDGPGIDDQLVGRIFDPYFTTKEKGSGLGLATVHFLVRQFNGTITVDTQPGRGTCFSLYFPASSEPLKRGNRNDNSLVCGNGRVLVMDDEPALQEILIEILQNLGYEAAAACNGEEAVRMYGDALDANQRFDLVIMDLTVPGGMGGKEAVMALLKIDSCVRALVSSGYHHDPVMDNYRAHGFCGRIAKPYRIEELSRVLADCLEDQPERKLHVS